jgi:sugar O-acyltransferase (sialic acid O-acetyltransferase NeuD family)
MSAVRLVVLGAGGNSLSIVDAVQACNQADPGRYELVGVLDDIPANLGKTLMGARVLGPIADAGRYPDCRFVNGISSLESFRRIPEIVRRTGLPAERFETIVHPRASVSPAARVGRGTAILAGSVIAAEAAVGDHVIILQNTSVNHHSHIGNHATLSAGITILGYVEVGANAFVGGGSTVAPRVRIGESAVVGAGSVVIRDVPAGRVFAGNPAHELAGSPHALD